MKSNEDVTNFALHILFIPQKGVETSCVSTPFLFARQHINAKNLHPQKRLIKLKQRLIDLKNIVIPIQNEIPNDLIEHAAPGQGEPDGGQQGLGLVQIQPQGDGEGDDGLLGGAVVLVALDLGEGALVHVGALVALHVGHAALVDERE